MWTRLSIIRWRRLCAACGLAVGLAAAPAQALDLGNLAGGLIDLARAATLSDSEARALALEASQHMDGKNPVAPPNHAYARRLARVVGGLQQEDGLALNFKVYLNKQVNAFAMANGTVRVYAGLLDAMSDDEVRFVIGHEIGHVKLGHSKKAMQVAYTASGVRGLAVGSGNQVLAQLGGSAIGGLAEAVVNAQFSQSQENEADAYAVAFMRRHGYPPQAALSALRKLQALGGDNAHILSSHPASSERLGRVEAEIQRH